MLKKTILLFIVTLSFALSGQTWLTNFDETAKKADQEKKVMLLYFSGSDWCRPCILLKKKVFETKEFKSFAGKNLVLAMFDFPAREQNKLEAAQIEHNEKIAEHYNPKGNFPHIVLVTTKGEKITEFSGYNNEPPEDYIAKLQKAITSK